MGKVVKKLINEAELFASFSAGDEKSFEIIYRHYSKRLFPYVEKLVKVPELTEELIQEIFVQIWINRQVFSTVQYPTAYLFSIAHRQALKCLQKIANDARILRKIISYAECASNETEEQMVLRESNEAINLAVAQLPGQRRLIWELSRNEGLTHKQIAMQLGISQSTVKNQMVHALKYVRGFLNKSDIVLPGLIIIVLTNRWL